MAIVSVNEAQVGGEVKTAEDSTPNSTTKMVRELLSRAKRAREAFDKYWRNNYEFVFGGRQWSINRPAWRFSESVNLVWANIMTEVGIQTDARPKVEYQATEPSDWDFAKQLQKINEVNWTKYPWLQRVADNVLQSKWVHVSHAEICWNPELENGLGDLEYKILDPFYCFWDPLATDIIDARHFIYAAPVCTAQLKTKYPDKAELIKPDIEIIATRYEGKSSPTSDRFQITGQYSQRNTQTTERFGGEPMTQLIRIWMRDDSAYDEEVAKEDGSTEYVRKKNYPKGRYIEMCGNTVLVDRENEYEDGEFPIARLVNYSYPGEYAGECEVTHLRGPQKVYNYVWSHILDQMKQGSNPKIVIGALSGADPDNISNEPGQKIIANDVNQVRFEPGLPIAGGMQFIMDQSKSAVDMVGGLTDVMKGAVDPAIGSGILFDGYAEAAQVRPRLKNRNLDQFLQRLGQLMLSRYLQFYTAPRVFRITNEQGFPEHVEFFITKDDQGNKMASVTRMQPGMPPETQQMPIKGVPDIEVQSGSALPFAKALRSKTAIEYLQAGVIDPEEVLKSVDWPNYEQVLERMQKAAAMAPPPK